MERMISLPSGRQIPALGFGTWHLGKNAGAFKKELALLKAALDVGYRSFDVADSYGDGGAEEIVGEAVSSCREDVFLTSKVSPVGLDKYDDVIESCEKTLERLQTDYLDLYLLHWPDHRTCKEEILEAFLDLKEDKKILDFGVSNFDTCDMKEWLELPGASATALNQFFFSLTHRSAEKNLLPLCHKKGIPLIAYALWVEYEGIDRNPVVRRIASDRGITPKQLNVAWPLSFENVGIIAMPDTVECIEEVYSGCGITLSAAEISALNKEFSTIH